MSDALDSGGRPLRGYRGVDGFRVGGPIWGRPLVLVEQPAPLLGAVFIGVIDRGTNVIQVRPTTLCPLSCVFCSVDAGPQSRWRAAEYQVADPAWLARWAGLVAEWKGGGVEALIDGVGDPFAYSRLVDLVRLLKEQPGIRWVAVETHGWRLSRRLVRALEEAGLDRVNLSLDTLDPEKARILAGTPWYDVRRVIDVAEFVVRETSIDLHVTPVWVPGLNDRDVVEVVRWAYRIGAGKRWPPATIQKFQVHRHGRRPRGAREIPWRAFWRRLKELERETGLRVTWTPEEWGMRPAPRVENPLRRGQRARLLVAAPGWIKGTVTAVTLDYSRLVTLRIPRSLPLPEPGRVVEARIVQDKDGILLAEPL